MFEKTALTGVSNKDWVCDYQEKPEKFVCDKRESFRAGKQEGWGVDRIEYSTLFVISLNIWDWMVYEY